MCFFCVALENCCQLPLLSWGVGLPCHAVAWLTFSPPSGRPLCGTKQVINQSILGQNGSRLDLREAHGGRGPAAAGSSSAGVISRLSLRYLAIFRRPRITLVTYGHKSTTGVKPTLVCRECVCEENGVKKSVVLFSRARRQQQ